MAHKLHPSQHRDSLDELSAGQRQRLRQLLDTYIATQNPVGEHLAASNNPNLHIHGHGFLAWHTVFIAKLELWLALNGGGDCTPSALGSRDGHSGRAQPWKPQARTPD